MLMVIVPELELNNRITNLNPIIRIPYFYKPDNNSIRFLKNFFNKLSREIKFKDDYEKIIESASEDNYIDAVFRIFVDENVHNVEKYLKKVDEINNLIEKTMKEMDHKNVAIDIINEYYKILTDYLREHNKSKLAKKLIEYLEKKLLIVVDKEKIEKIKENSFKLKLLIDKLGPILADDKKFKIIYENIKNILQEEGRTIDDNEIDKKVKFYKNNFLI